MEHVARVRWLVPVVAVAAEVDDSGDSGYPMVETRTDMATVTLTAPDGSRALPVFTSLAALAAWVSTRSPLTLP